MSGFADNELIVRLSEVKPNLKPASLKQYITQLRGIHKKIYDKSLVPKTPSWILFGDAISTEDKSNIENVFKFIKVKNDGSPAHITSQRNTITAIINYIKIFKQNEDTRIALELYGNEMIRLNKEQNKNYEQNVVSEATEKKLKISMDDLYKLIDKLTTSGRVLDAMLLSLTVNYHFRNEIGRLKLIGKSKYEKLTDEDKLKENYIVKYYNTYFISRGLFKTSGKYGLTITDIELPQVIELINLYIKKVMKSRKTNKDIFFLNENTNSFLTNEHVSQRLGRVTEKELGVKLGTSSINKIYMNSLNSDTIEELKKLSQDRGTSIATLILAYYNKPLVET